MELGRCPQLNSAISMSTGFAILLGGFLGTMAKRFSWPDGLAGASFAMLFALAAATLLISVILLAKAFWGHSYKLLAHPRDLLNWSRELKNHFEREESSSASTDEAATQEFENRVMELLAEATSSNCIQSDKRSANIFWANGWILLSLLFTALAVVPYSLAT